MRGVIEVDLGDISTVNLSLCQSNLLRKSNLVEPIEPIILQSSLCVDKSEQEAASLCYQAEKAEYIYSDLVNCHSLAHSDSSSSQATIVSSSLSKELSVSLPCRSSSSSLATCLTSVLPLVNPAGTPPRPHLACAADNSGLKFLLPPRQQLQGVKIIRCR